MSRSEMQDEGAEGSRWELWRGPRKMHGACHTLARALRIGWARWGVLVLVTQAKLGNRASLVPPPELPPEKEERGAPGSRPQTLVIARVHNSNLSLIDGLIDRSYAVARCCIEAGTPAHFIKILESHGSIIVCGKWEALTFPPHEACKQGMNSSMLTLIIDRRGLAQLTNPAEQACRRNTETSGEEPNYGCAPFDACSPEKARRSGCVRFRSS